MLSRKQKEDIVGKLKGALKDNKLLVVADFKGLGVIKMQELKRMVKETGGKVRVAKKTLMNIALKDEKVDFDVKKFEGPLMFIFGEEEVPKAVWNFIKQNEGLKIEAGILEGKALEADEVEALAKLPGIEELLASTVFVLKSPINGFVGVMRNALGSFVNVMKAIADDKVEA